MQNQCESEEAPPSVSSDKNDFEVVKVENQVRFRLNLTKITRLPI